MSSEGDWERGSTDTGKRRRGAGESQAPGAAAAARRGAAGGGLSEQEAGEGALGNQDVGDVAQSAESRQSVQVGPKQSLLPNSTKTPSPTRG